MAYKSALTLIRRRLSEEKIIAALGRLKSSRKNLLQRDDIGAFEANGRIYAATDSLVDGVHYLNAWLSPADIAYKLFARNYSDFAVKGIKPEFALLNLGLSLEHSTSGFVHPFLHELDALLTRFGITLVGGDTGRAPHDHFSLSLFGGSGTLIPRKAKQLQPGDLVFQIGAVGGSDAARALLERGGPLRRKSIHNFTRPAFLQNYPPGLRPKAAIDQSDSVEKSLRLLAEANAAELQIDLEAMLTAQEIGPVTETTALQVLGAAEDLAVFGILSADGSSPAESSPAFRLIGRVKYIRKTRPGVSYKLNGRKFAHRAKSFEHFS